MLWCLIVLIRTIIILFSYKTYLLNCTFLESSNIFFSYVQNNFIMSLFYFSIIFIDIVSIYLFLNMPICEEYYFTRCKYKNSLILSKLIIIFIMITILIILEYATFLFFYIIYNQSVNINECLFLLYKLLIPRLSLIFAFSMFNILLLKNIITIIIVTMLFFFNVFIKLSDNIFFIITNLSINNIENKNLILNIVILIISTAIIIFFEPRINKLNKEEEIKNEYS